MSFFEFVKGYSTNNCQTCGNCCKNHLVELTDSELEKIVEQISLKLDEFTEEEYDLDKSIFFRYMKVVGEENRCFFLDYDPISETYSCRIYDIRPQICRDYPHSYRKIFKTCLS